MAIKWKNNKESKITEEITLEKNGKKKYTWIGYLLICVFVTVVALTTYYIEPELRNVREKNQKEQQQEIEEQKAQTLDLETYSAKDKMALISNIYYLNYELENMYAGVSPSEYLLKSNKAYNSLTSGKKRAIYEDEAKRLVDVLYTVYRMDFSVDGGKSTYTCMYDNKRGVFTGQSDLVNVVLGKNIQEVQKDYQGYLVISFDEKGNPSITDKYNIEEGSFLKYLNNIKLQAVANYYKNQNLYIYETDTTSTDAIEFTGEYAQEYDEDVIYEEESVASEETVTVSEEESVSAEIDFPKIKNAQVVIGFLENNGTDYDYEGEYELCYFIVLGAMAILFVGALILQNISSLDLKKQAVFCIPTEIVVLAGFFGLIFTLNADFPAVMLLEVKESLQSWAADGNMAINTVLLKHIPAVIYLGIWLAYYGAVYWGIANVIPYLLHPIQNIMEKSILVEIGRWLLKQWKRCFRYITTIQVEKGIKANLIKILAVNFIIVGLLCCGWFLGILGAVVYSVLLYFVLAKRVGKLQKEYQGVMSVVSDMAEGELTLEVPENLGMFEPLKQELMKVRTGFQHAVEAEVKSQNMKTELITNVSHDLKTPLTAIITYVDLLKNENIDEETRKEYITTLDKKSQRLKVLIEDLFEVSKATSNNITLHYADVDLVNLVKQVRLENEERIMNSDLIFRWNLPEEKCVLRLDPQRTYRVIENLLINALKYSMSGSRVYVDVSAKQDTVSFAIKNISATELNFEAEQLTERFVRGDVSRNTEGSGLGLAIARSFTELQNGKFTVEIDGDLFKVTIAFVKDKVI